MFENPSQMRTFLARLSLMFLFLLTQILLGTHSTSKKMNSEPVYVLSDIPLTTPRIKMTPSRPSFWTFWNIATIAGGVAAFVFVTSIIIIVVVLCKRRRESVHATREVEYPDLCPTSSTFFLSAENNDNGMLTVTYRNPDDVNRRNRNPGRHVNSESTSVALASSADNFSERPSECLQPGEDELQSPVLPRKQHGDRRAFNRQLSEQTVDRHGAGNTVDTRQSESEAIYDVPKIAIRRTAHDTTLVWTREKADRKSSTPSGGQKKKNSRSGVYDIPRNLSFKRFRVSKSSH